MSDFVRYRLGHTSLIDGPSFAIGTEVEVKIIAEVKADSFFTGEIDVPVFLLQVNDWEGPVAAPAPVSLTDVEREERAWWLGRAGVALNGNPEADEISQLTAVLKVIEHGWRR